MLSFDEFTQKLTTLTVGPDWLHAYVDKSGCFWIQAYGGMGTSIFKKLESYHPFVGYIETLIKDGKLQQQPFKFQYEAGGEELAKLQPNITANPDDVFNELEKARASGELSRAIEKGRPGRK